MAENKDVINRALEEHHAIRETVELDGGSVSDFEALFALRQAYAGWSQCAPEELPARHQQLLKTLELVDRGLRLHWGYEEKAIQPIFGEPLMKAFLYEHHDIARKLENARQVIGGEKLAGLEPQALLAKKTAIQDIINHLMQAIEEHSNHEDMIFKMLKKGLENE
jgi:hypothetical protein